MYELTQTEKDVCQRFGWTLIDVGKSQPASRNRGEPTMFLTHHLLHGEATMAIPVDLERHTLTQAVATAAYTFNPVAWMRSADRSKYPPHPYISLETQIKGDAEYAQRELNTLCSALGIR